MTTTKVKIVEEEPDPICPRASIGGNIEHGFYLVWRSGPSSEEGKQYIAEMLELVLNVLKDEMKHGT